jgi:hypothetical protein
MMDGTMTVSYLKPSMKMTDKADFPPGARLFLAAFGRYEHFLHECSRRAF